ncbi:MAG TPA: HAD family phosphatase [Patescibacteria group bacterium]|nr:HAD family phosphatase [Patescibacteria group bacterium]
MKLQAVIFDLDNVLIDSEKLWPEIDQAFFSDYLGKDNWRKWRTVWLAMRKNTFQLREIMARLKEMFDKKESPLEIIDLRMEKMFEVYREKLTLRPGVQEVLEKLKAENIQIAIASGMNMKIIKFAVELFGWQDKIAVLASTHEGKKNKPDPEVFFLAAKRLSVELKNCLVVENELNGVKAGKAAGICTLAVPYPVKQTAEIKRIADLTINSLSEFNLDEIKRFLL